MKSPNLLTGHKVLLHPPYKAMRTPDRLLHACLLAYAKHVNNSPHIGWEQVGDTLLNAICEAIGDDEFVKWNAMIGNEVDQSDVED